MAETLKVLPLDATAQKIREVLTADLLKPQWRVANHGAHPMTGHCYVASEAYYHARGKELGFRPRVLRMGEITHWWLQNDQGEVMDLTAEQFAAGVAYENGKGIGFLTTAPSARAATVLERAGLSKNTRSPEKGRGIKR